MPPNGNIRGMHAIRLFADVARYHSFSQAAKLHGITQSAASQRVGQLEKRLGVQLLDRSVRPLELTAAGKIFLEGCDDVLQRYDRLERKICSMKDDPSGTVRVAAIYSSGIELLERIRHAFEEAHRRVDIEITYLKPDEIHRLVLDGGADLGLVSYPERFKKVKVIQLREEVMAVVCAQGHPLAGLGSVTPAQLSPYTMVSFDLDLPVGRRIKAYLKEHGSSPEITHCFDNLDTLKTAVSVTESFAILPKRTVIREVEAGSLAMVELTPTLVRPIGAIHRARSHHGGGRSPLPPAVHAFVEHLVKSAGPEVDVVGTLTRDVELIGTR